MSALTDLFTAMANKIRSKTGTQTTYTPSEMVSNGIDDVFDAGVASVPTPTSITPSNATPANLTANIPVKPTNIGYAIRSFDDLLPSNTNPASIVDGNMYRATYNGYAILSYSNRTPSDTSPASVSSGAIIKASSSGYFVKNKPVDLGVPDLVSQVDISGSSSRSITVTSKPRLVILIESQRGSEGAQFLQIYDSVNDKYTAASYTANNGYSDASGTGLPGRITTVSATTVTVRNASTGYGVRSSVLIYY